MGLDKGAASGIRMAYGKGREIPRSFLRKEWGTRLNARALFSAANVYVAPFQALLCSGLVRSKFQAIQVSYGKRMQLAALLLSRAGLNLAFAGSLG